MTGQTQNDAQDRADAGRPGEGEGHPHDRRGPATELGGPHVEAMLTGHAETTPTVPAPACTHTRCGSELSTMTTPRKMMMAPLA